MTDNSTLALRFGVIADPQYAPLPPHLGMDRHYGESLTKIEAAIARFNEAPLDFVVTLGDLIDRDWASFAPALDAYRASRHECLFLAGNHDFAVADEHLPRVYDRLGMPSPYYERCVNGVRLIFIDGNEVSLFAPPPDDSRRALARERLADMRRAEAPNAQEWNAGLSEVQFAWLGERLRLAAEAGERAIVFGHYPVHPFSDHALWDAEKVAALMASSPAMVAYCCGHFHGGNYGRRGHPHFINFKGMVDTRTENAFSIVSLYPDRLEIEGFGREESRSLPL